MNNFELHDKVIELVDTTTHYEIAKKYLQLKEDFFSMSEELKRIDAYILSVSFGEDVK